MAEIEDLSLDVIDQICTLDGLRFFPGHLKFAFLDVKAYSFGTTKLIDHRKYNLNEKCICILLPSFAFNFKIRYAVVDGNACFCTNTINETELKDTDCDRPCSENQEEFCGGEYAQSYFDTNIKVSPPRNLEIITRTENTILMQWNRPEQENALNRFIIWANLIKTYGSKVLQPHQWTIESMENTVQYQYDLINLNPGNWFCAICHIIYFEISSKC